MERLIQTQKTTQLIARDKAKGGGVIRIDEEACDILEGIAKKLEASVSIKELASSFIKAAADNAVIKEEEEEE